MNRRERNLVRAAIVLGVFLGLSGCQATVQQAPQAETVGTLTAGPSTWSAPVHETTPPPSETYVTHARRERQSNAGEAVAAPEVEAKGQGLQFGSAR